MKKLLILSFVFALTACITPPQSRDEFVGKIKQGAGFSSYQTITVNRSLDAVLSSLRAPLKQCLNVEIQGHWARGGVRTSNIVTTRHLTTLKRIARNKAELTMQTTYDPASGAQPPKGGYYDFAIDFEALGHSKTKAVLYSGMSGQGDINAAFINWINGKRAACPLTENTN